MYDGLKAYEIRRKSTGEVIAKGDIGTCALQLHVCKATIDKAAKNPNHKWMLVKCIGTIRKIYTVFDDNEGLLASGTLKEVAEAMGVKANTVRQWAVNERYKKSGISVKVKRETVPLEEGDQG